MKRSELKNYIRENILSSLSEDTSGEIEKTKELTAAVKDLNTAKKEAGIEEANIGSADLAEMGYEAGKESFDMHFKKSVLKNRPDTESYTNGFTQAIVDRVKNFTFNENEGRTKMPTQDQVNKFFSLTQNEMHYLNSKPVAGQEKTFNDTEVEPWDEYDLSNWNSLVKKAKTKGKSIDENIDEGNDKIDREKIEGILWDLKNSNKLSNPSDPKKKEALIKKLEKQLKKESVNEDDDAEPTKKDIKKTKGLAKAKEELALLTREMKSLAKKYSKAEGEEKEKLVKTLKAKTKLKKELESILDKKKI